MTMSTTQAGTTRLCGFCGEPAHWTAEDDRRAAAIEAEPGWWADTTPAVFGMTDADQPLTLFPAPDPCGTPDMFDTDGEP